MSQPRGGGTNIAHLLLSSLLNRRLTVAACQSVLLELLPRRKCFLSSRDLTLLAESGPIWIEAERAIGGHVRGGAKRSVRKSC